jgi:hypothetical protein
MIFLDKMPFLEIKQNMTSNKNNLISRRAVIKQFNHLLLGSATAYLVMTKSYQKPSLSKMKGLYDAAVLATSNPDPVLPG